MTVYSPITLVFLKKLGIEKIGLDLIRDVLNVICIFGFVIALEQSSFVVVSHIFKKKFRFLFTLKKRIYIILNIFSSGPVI